MISDYMLLNAFKEVIAEKLDRGKFIPGKTYIPAAAPKLYPDDVLMLHEAVANLWYTEWKFAELFKKELCKVTNTQYATLCNSGSSANLLAIKSCLEVINNSGKYIVTCACGFPTTIAPIYQNGKVPLYIDIDPFTFHPKWQDIQDAWSEYSAAGIILTHTLGFPYPEDAVAPNDEFFIADCCDCLGGVFGDSRVGSWADVATHSFFPSHGITTGEGGALTTSEDKLYLQIEKNSNWGRSCTCKPGQNNTCGHRFDWAERGDLPEGWDHKYIFDMLGYNLKMTDLQAALGYSQIQHLPDFISHRRRLFQKFYAFCMNQIHIRTVNVFDGISPVPFGLPIMVNEDAPFTAREMVEYLEKAKIGTRRFFGGNIIRQPGYKDLEYEIVSDLTGCDYLMNNAFWIGCGPSVTDEMFDYMMNIIDDFLMEIR